VIKLKIRKGDTVQVTAGADKGKKGEVIAVDPKAMKIQVQGVRVQTHFDKKDGLLKKEGLIDYSNVKLVSRAAAEKASGAKTTKKAAKRKSA
jgi:large subunit ribosomal protein L24